MGVFGPAIGGCGGLRLVLGMRGVEDQGGGVQEMERERVSRVNVRVGWRGAQELYGNGKFTSSEKGGQWDESEVARG